ncbi:mitochondrial 10-formyltetrahydrofolate dehydrogenase isoform X2 [Nilaparvata lugens]|nr:mitochondrial 10-formyltetrahydrofolate dehydrogenase isoform X2 [Nilaparvata lugens]
MEVIDFPMHRSICYHPSILPKHRGVSSINWTLMNGDKKAGFTIFWADDGLDTGPILLQHSCDVEENDTVDTLYNRFLYPEGIKAMAEAVDLVAAGKAPKIVQPQEGASFEPSVRKKSFRKVNWDQPATAIHNFVRGLDSSPGAWTVVKNTEVILYSSKIWPKSSREPQGESVEIEGCPTNGIIHSNGILVPGNDGAYVNFERISIAGRMIPAANFGKKEEEKVSIVLTTEEEKIIPLLKTIWTNILSTEVDNSTHFFESGARSMDVVRLVEELKNKLKVQLKNEDVFMSPVFESFCSIVIMKLRHGDIQKSIVFDAVNLHVNNIDLKFPKQLFIDGTFINAENGNAMKCVNPTDESIICEVQCASQKDVGSAVAAAKKAFEEGEWSKISNRERATMMLKLADLMEANQEELATLESIDSGAVYSLALKTHIGMSIETWRYFAGWADKLQGSTIPITHARPSRNLSFTRKEPIGVVGLIVPWNYPLMMLSWKMAPCFAAGNTVVIKPAEVTPLTALKFAQLSTLAGFPPGVINVVPGTGAVAGVALAEHPDVRKIGFTGSTAVGKLIMRAGSNNKLKRVSLELGGKSPLVILGDADISKAVRMSMGGVFFNKGENCIAAGRVFVESKIHDEFVRKVVEETKKMVIGNPLDRGTDHGPQNHKAHLEKLIAYCRKGQEEGAKLLVGGNRCDRPGYFFEPTIFTDVEDHMYIAKEEAFGPVMVISKFDYRNIDDIIKRANSTEYGLASGICTKNIDRALYFAEKIDSGTVFVNTYNKTDVAAPFGGFKESGFGKDLGEEALHEYLRIKTVTIEYGG